jgi:hypothetical protein
MMLRCETCGASVFGLVQKVRRGECVVGQIGILVCDEIDTNDGRMT